MKYRYEHTYSEEKTNADATMNDYFENLLSGNYTNEIPNASEEPSK
jgi:hypothetical protein